MTTSQRRRQWHQLDNGGDKKEARFNGWERERERERERKTWIWDWSVKLIQWNPSIFLLNFSRVGSVSTGPWEKIDDVVFASTRINYPYLWFRIWFLLLGFFHLSLFVLGVFVDGGKRIGLLLVLLKIDWWVCVCILAGFVCICVCVLAGFVFLFLLNLMFVF